MKEFPKRLYHPVPNWVKDGELFHIRIRCVAANPVPLTNPALAMKIIESAKEYSAQKIWHCGLLMLMPDHLHALLAFAPTRRMSQVVADWKRFHARNHGVVWQGNYFDHRIRSDADGQKTYLYIMRNPVVLGLCAEVNDWPFVLR
jgi:putative transposase